MAANGTFDPYYKWLGIAPKDQPPNCYRLLGLDLYEADPDVIASAADQRMAHVRTFLLGPHAAYTQRILNELATARTRLLNPREKSAYDAQLLQTQDCQIPDAGRLVAAVAPPPSQPQPPPPDRVEFDPTSGERDSAPFRATHGNDEPFAPHEFVARPRPQRRRSPISGLVNVVGLVVSSALGLTLGYLILCWIGPQYDFLHFFNRKPGQPAPPVAQRPGKENPQPQPAADPVANQPPPAAEPAEVIPQDEPPINVPSDTVAEPNPPAVPGIRQPIPTAAELQSATVHAKDLLKDAKPADALATIGADLTPAERYALLVACKDAAVAAGDCESAFRAVDLLAEGFLVEALPLQSETVRTLRGSSTVPRAGYGPLAEQSMILADRAKQAGQLDSAKEFAESALWAARKSGDQELIRRATMAVLESKRTPTD